MELSDYVKIVQKHLITILGITLVFVAIVAAMVGFSKPKYESNITLTVDRPNAFDQKSVTYFTYDNYYSLQSSSLIADTVINWLQSPSVVESIYRRAGIELPTVRNVALLGKVFTVRKYQPSTLSITFRSNDPTQGVTLLQAATTELQERSNELGNKNDTDQVVVHSTTPVSAEVVPFWALDIVVATLIGLLASVFFVFIREYVRAK